MSRLNDLLRQLATTDPAMAKELQREYDALADRRAFGLNFERHMPEVVELPGRRIRRGDKVHVLPERGKNPTAENSRLWRVLTVDRTSEHATASLEAMHGDETTDATVEDLVVVAEFRDPIYPGLVSTGRIERGGDKPFHAVINAENHHALQTLLFTHRAQVDCIYIDQPYNTGNEGWIYNDRYVAADDHYKHSKWLAFLERRLLLAKELLKPTGVIVAAIGDDEQHRLRMLMDQVFAADNFIANVVWQGGGSSLSRFHAGGLDYMLVYANDMSALTASGVRWKVEKEGLQDVLDAAANAWSKSGQDSANASRLLSAWWNKNKSKYDPGLGDNVKVDSDGVAVKVGDLGNSLYRPNLRYPITDPETGVVYEPPDNGWRFKKEVMDDLIANGGVMFGARPRMKTPLHEMSMRSVVPSFYKDRRSASQHLSKVLGTKDFPYPKDVEVIARWLGIATMRDPDALFLDFFAGTGTTAEAVMHLNTADGGRRQSVVVTNNEVAAENASRLRKDGHRPGDACWEDLGVYEHVAKPRIQTVATGVRPDGSAYSEGLDQNVEFFTLTYEAPLRVSSNREFARIAPLLWLRAGSQGRRIDDMSPGWDVAETYGVIADLDKTEPFLKAVADAADRLRIVYVVTDEDRLFQSIAGELPGHIEVVRLYEAYLRNFEIEAGRSAL